MIHTIRAEHAVENVRRLDSTALTAAGKLLLSKAIAENHRGSGLEKDVFDYRPGLVISFFTHARMEPHRMTSMLKSCYYSAKLGHLLMPDSIPDAHLAASQPPAIVFDRIYGERDGITLEERHQFRLKLYKIGITHACDLADGNLLRRPDGSLAYVDTVNASMLAGNPELDEYMDTLAPRTAAEARRLQSRLLFHSSRW